MRQSENPFLSLLFNLLLPVVILNHGHRFFHFLGPVSSLIIAVSLPVTWGLKDYFLNNKYKNPLSIIGALNVLLSGGFALLMLDGIWFAVKEAFFPLAIGVWFLASAFGKSSLMEWVVKKSSIFRWDRIEPCLHNEEKKSLYQRLLKKSTIALSFCFFFSSILNFFTALWIFVWQPPPKTLSAEETQILINEQIADMTWISFLIIGLPLTIVSGLVMYRFVHDLKNLTSLKIEQILRT